MYKRGRKKRRRERKGERKEKDGEEAKARRGESEKDSRGRRREGQGERHRVQGTRHRPEPLVRVQRRGYGLCAPRAHCAGVLRVLIDRCCCPRAVRLRAPIIVAFGGVIHAVGAVVVVLRAVMLRWAPNAAVRRHACGRCIVSSGRNWWALASTFRRLPWRRSTGDAVFLEG